MQNGAMKAWLDSSYLSGANQSWIEQLYEDFLTDPDSVDANWRSMFQQLPGTGVKPDQFHSKTRDYFRRLAKDASRYSSAISDPDTNAKQVKVLQLINAYRFRGHQHANLDPLGLWKQDRVADLDPAYHDLTEADFQESFNVGSFAIGKDTMKLGDLIDALKQTYCGSIGAEYMHITSTEEKRWIQQRIESVAGHATFSADEKKRFLSELTAAEGLERYLGAKFPGAKRFSLEGGDALVPMLKELIRHAGKSGTREVVLGMAHRGRLNVLVNVLGKKPQDLFDEFAGKHKEHLGTGDVKYHMGFSADVATDGGPVHLALAFNPSHLEIADPVVAGSVRSRQERRKDTARKQVMPILIHGDAAFSGQGVVMELFQMSQARGFAVGGTVHIVVNNQVGFTTSNPLDTRSTRYATDVAKMIAAPVLHVNGDDPEAVVFAAQLAFEFRQKFAKDVVIDLMCYRRWGHNEADEPAITQPLMYQVIRKHPTTREMYAEQLEKAGVIAAGAGKAMVDAYREKLDAGEVTTELAKVEKTPPTSPLFVDWPKLLEGKLSDPVSTKVEKNKLVELAKLINTIPEDVQLHSRVAKVYDDRRKMAAGEIPGDWGFAENLAYATLLDEGHALRLVGQDVGRGTFTHRHAILHDQKTDNYYMPLRQLVDSPEKATVIDSLLSEEAVMAYEYGFSTTDPNTLCIWEGQFGDFVNGAQVVIDQFISSGEAKWGRQSGLTLMLPHGYEGQGPEHSSGRIERFLQLCADNNMQVIQPTSASQIFHVLRRQMIRPFRKPLVLFTPKSLLRNKDAGSPLTDLAGGSFRPVIGEVDEAIDASKVKRVLACSGKVYYDLVNARRERGADNVAIIRVEQLYPFAHKSFEAELRKYSKATEVIWVQDEPQNQGPWFYVQHHVYENMVEGQKLGYAGRAASASPAVGYLAKHQEQQKALIETAFAPKFKVMLTK